MPHRDGTSRADAPAGTARATVRDRQTGDDEASLWESVRRLGTTEVHIAGPDLVPPGAGDTRR